MSRNIPNCSDKCNECLFYYTKMCVALAGDDYFKKINAEQAYLIIMNQSRFKLPETLSEELSQMFPNLLN